MVVCKQKRFTDKTTHRQQAKHSVKNMSHIMWHINPKFNLWIYVWVMECHSLFSATVTLISGVRSWKKCTLSRSPILFMVAVPYLVCRYILGPWRVTNWLQVTVTLTSGFSSSKVEPRKYLYIIWGRNSKFSVRIHFWTMACRIYFWVSLTCNLCINMFKIL